MNKKLKTITIALSLYLSFAYQNEVESMIGIQTLRKWEQKYVKEATSTEDKLKIAPDNSDFTNAIAHLFALPGKTPIVTKFGHTIPRYRGRKKSVISARKEKEELWNKYCPVAPKRQRGYIERYKTVKRK
jgi:hypothetical protein